MYKRQRVQIEVWNKLDALSEDASDAARARAEREENVFAISALTGEGIAPLLEHVAQTLQATVTIETLNLPYSEGRKRAWLFEQDVVQDETQDEDGFALSVQWTAIQKARYEGL